MVTVTDVLTRVTEKKKLQNGHNRVNTSKDATVRLTKNSTNAEILTQVGYFSDTPRIMRKTTRGIHSDQNCEKHLRFSRLSSLRFTVLGIFFTRIGAVMSQRSLLQVLEWKSILFQSVYLRFIPNEYDWMRNLFPTHGLIRSESPNDSVRLRFILFQSKLMSQVYAEWFRINQNKILIPFKSV